MALKDERIQLINDAIADGCTTVRAISERTGLRLGIIYYYRERGYITIPAQDRIGRPKNTPGSYIRQLLEGNGERSLEVLCQTLRIGVDRLWETARIEGIDLSLYELKPYRFRPAMDAAIDAGLSLEEVGATENVVGERARQYIVRSGQQDYWKCRKRVRKDENVREVHERYTVRGSLVSLLQERMVALAAEEDIATQQAWHYLLSKRRRSQVKFSEIQAALQQYHTAKGQSNRISLKQLTEGLDLHPVSLRRVLRNNDEETLHSPQQDRRIRSSEWKKEQLKHAVDLPLSTFDIAFFLGLKYPNVASYYNHSLNVKRGHLWLKQFSSARRLTYCCASQIYEAADAGFAFEDIVSIVEPFPDVVAYALNHRDEIQPQIINSLRELYPKRRITQPYILEGEKHIEDTNLAQIARWTHTYQFAYPRSHLTREQLALFFRLYLFSEKHNTNASLHDLGEGINVSAQTARKILRTVDLDLLT